MKRLTSLLLILCLVLLLLPATLAVAAESDLVPYAVEGGNIYFDPTTGTVVSCDEAITRAVIPSQIGGVTVKALRNCSFWLRSETPVLESVVLPDTLESIGSECFRGQSALTEITIPSGITTIEFGTFQACTGLKTVSLPTTLRTIEYIAFYGCTSLEEITLPEGLEEISDFVFYGCTSLSSLNIPGSVYEVGSELLVNTPYEQDPANWVGGGLYLDNWLLCADSDREELTVRLGTRGIASNLVYRGSQIKTVHLPEGLKYISSNCFDNSDLSTLTIPSTVERIGERSFRYFMYPTRLTLYFKGDAPITGRDQFISSITSSIFGNGGHRPVVIYRSADSTGWEQESLEGCTFMDWDSPCKKFTDLSSDQWYYGAVSAMIDRGLMNGMNDTSFAPNRTMTRAMLVTVLWRYSGSPEGYESTFTDVEDTQWYAKAVAWAAETGIVNGVGNNRFSPDGLITREQLVTMFYRFATINGMDTSLRTNPLPFPDAESVSTYAQEPISWAVATGLLNGIAKNGVVTLSPQGNATRAQVCAILQRYLEQQ